MVNSLEHISNVIIRKWEGVISAIWSTFPNLTKGEVFMLAQSACARLKWEIRKGDICTTLYTGQKVAIPSVKKDESPQPPIQTESLIFSNIDTGLVKTGTGKDATYTLNGKELPKNSKPT
jgi:hypothetical protein